MAMGKQTDDIKETLCRVLHDHSIGNALEQFIKDYDEKDIEKLRAAIAKELGIKLPKKAAPAKGKKGKK